MLLVAPFFQKKQYFWQKKSLLCVEVCIQNLDFVFGMKTCNIETGTFSIFRMFFFNIGPLGLVADLPLRKMMEFVSWDDDMEYDIPNMMGKS